MSGGGAKVKPSRGEIDQANVAKEQYDDYQERFVPLENSYIEDALSIRDERPLATGQANADATQAFSGAIDQTEDLSFAQAVNPNSGKHISMFSDIYADRGSGVGASTVNADQSTEDRFRAGQSNLISFGKGQSSDATTGMRNYARIDQHNAISDAQEKASNTTSKYQLLGAVAGGATRSAARTYSGNDWATAPGPRTL